MSQNKKSQTKLDELLDRLQLLESELEQELENIIEEKKALFQYTLKKGKVKFKKQVKALQRQQKKAIITFLKEADLRNIISAPIIYSVIIPLVFIDLSVTLYQHSCFRLYRIPRVKRSDYIIIDRQYLAYLNIIEKFNCVYCGYGNGVMAYVREIIARTEQYWCPIKHAKKTLDNHSLAANFVDYGDALAYKKNLKALRKSLSTHV